MQNRYFEVLQDIIAIGIIGYSSFVLLGSDWKTSGPGFAGFDWVQNIQNLFFIALLFAGISFSRTLVLQLRVSGLMGQKIARLLQYFGIAMIATALLFLLPIALFLLIFTFGGSGHLSSNDLVNLFLILFLLLVCISVFLLLKRQLAADESKAQLRMKENAE
jgi:hypothetical protein